VFGVLLLGLLFRRSGGGRAQSGSVSKAA
jgi:hypothetical protein